MAHILRLILAVLVSLASHSAFAFAPNVSEWCNNENYGCMYLSGPAACEGMNARYGYQIFVSAQGAGADVYKCLMSDGRIGGYAHRSLTCPPNSTLVSGDCSCSAGYEEKNGKCEPKPPECKSDEILQDGVCRKKNPCPEGQHEEGGACVPDQCKPDEIRENGQCVPEKCPDGQNKVNGKCPDKCERLKGTQGSYSIFGATSISSLPLLS